MSEMSELAKHARQYKDEVDELRSEITKTVSFKLIFPFLNDHIRRQGKHKYDTCI